MLFMNSQMKGRARERTIGCHERHREDQPEAEQGWWAGMDVVCEAQREKRGRRLRERREGKLREGMEKAEREERES